MRHLDPVTGLLWALEREQRRALSNGQAAVERYTLGRLLGGGHLLTPAVEVHYNRLQALESHAGLTHTTRVEIVEGLDGRDGVYDVQSKTIGQGSIPMAAATYRVTISRALQAGNEVYRCVDCECGLVMRDALPCKHVAYVATKARLPLVEMFLPCWRSSTWRSQYLAESPVPPSHSQLRNFTSNANLFLAFAAPPKRGRPTSTRRHMSAQELARGSSSSSHIKKMHKTVG